MKKKGQSGQWRKKKWWWNVYAIRLKGLQKTQNPQIFYIKHNRRIHAGNWGVSRACATVVFPQWLHGTDNSKVAMMAVPMWIPITAAGIKAKLSQLSQQEFFCFAAISRTIERDEIYKAPQRGVHVIPPPPRARACWDASLNPRIQ